MEWCGNQLPFLPQVTEPSLRLIPPSKVLIHRLVCRLHPWDYGDEGLRGVAQQHCPTDLLPEGVTVVEIIGISEEQAAVWHAVLFQEVLREYPMS